MLRRLVRNPLVITLSLAALALVSVAAVHDDVAAKPTSTATTAPVPAPVADAGPPETAPIADADKRFAGTVREVLFAGSYVYVEVELAEGDARWVVGIDDPPRVGDRVQVRAHGERRDFHSARLDRDFERLLFGEFSPLG